MNDEGDPRDTKHDLSTIRHQEVDTWSPSRRHSIPCFNRGESLPTPWTNEFVGNTCTTKPMLRPQSLHPTNIMYCPPPDVCPGTLLILCSRDPRRCKAASGTPCLKSLLLALSDTILVAFSVPSRVCHLPFTSDGVTHGAYDQVVLCTVSVGFCTPTIVPSVRPSVPLRRPFGSITFCLWPSS